MSAQAGKNKSAQPTAGYNNRFAIIIKQFPARYKHRRPAHCHKIPQNFAKGWQAAGKMLL
jgi:hypothetical protein